MVEETQMSNLDSSPRTSNTIFDELNAMVNAHFDRLPPSYEFEVSDVEEVLVHMWILKRTEKSHNLEHEVWVIDKQSSISYNVAVAGSYNSNLHTELLETVSDCKLKICSADYFETKDGFSLHVFVVEPWQCSDNLEDLSSMIQAAISKKEEANPCNKDINLELLDIGEQISSEPANLYRGTYQGQEVFIKKLLLNDTLFVPCNFWTGMEILSGLEHQNVVQFLGATASTKHGLKIVTEYMSGGNLFNYLQNNHGILTLSQRLKLAISIAKGIEYLHDNNIIHKNLNSFNLLLDKDEDVKVDISTALYMDWAGMMTTPNGNKMAFDLLSTRDTKTRTWCRWTEPEAMKRREYNKRSDVYSFGMVLWQLLTAKVPYEHLDYMDPYNTFIRVIAGLRPEIPMETNAKLREMIEECWDGEAPHISKIRAALESLLSEVNAPPKPTSAAPTTLAAPKKIIFSSTLSLKNQFHCLEDIE